MMEPVRVVAYRIAVLLSQSYCTLRYLFVTGFPFSHSWPANCYVEQAALDLADLPTSASKCSDYRCAPHPACCT